MNSTIDILFLRRPQIDYVSPAICEVLFSSSGGPIIVLDPLDVITGITGLVWGGVGGFHLSWNSYPGAICYSVYKLVDELNPFGPYAVIAECISDNFFDADDFGDGTYKVSVITPDGETPLSDVIVISHPAPLLLPSPKLYWTFDDNLIDSVQGVGLTLTGGSGSVSFIPATIGNGAEIVNAPDGENDYSNDTGTDDTRLALNTAGGFSVCGFVTVGIGAAWTMEFIWNLDASTERFFIEVSGGGARARGEVFHTTSAVAGYVDGERIFFRAWWDNVDHMVRIQINNGPIATSFFPADFVGNITGQCFLSNDSGTSLTDEIGVYMPQVTDEEASNLYNGGAGARPTLPP